MSFAKIQVHDWSVVDLQGVGGLALGMSGRWRSCSTIVLCTLDGMCVGRGALQEAILEDFRLTQRWRLPFARSISRNVDFPD